MQELSVVHIDLTSRQLSLFRGLGPTSDGIQRLAQHNSVEVVVVTTKAAQNLFIFGKFK